MIDILFKIFEKTMEFVLSHIKLRHTKTSNTIAIPKQTLRILPMANRSWWHMGKNGDNPAMQVVFDFDVTNITKLGILITGTKLKYPKIVGHVSVRKHGANIYGRYMIPPLTVSDGRADYWITRPVKREKELFKADICLIDQFGNEHWVKGVEFRYS